MSLKPPWKQRNHIMEKACQEYHKQTAPAKAVEILKNMKVSVGGSPVKKWEIVLNGEAWGNKKVTTAIFKSKSNYPLVVVAVVTPRPVIRAAKFAFNPKGRIRYKGRDIITLPGNSISVGEWKG